MQNGISTLHMIRREVQRARLNTVLCLLSVLLAVGVLVAMFSLTRASVDATRVMMKNMGFNVLITPAGVDPARYQALDFQDEYMPEEYVKRLADSTVLAQHFVGKLQKTVSVDGCTAVLTGVLPEVPKTGTRKRPMPTAYVVPEGHVFIAAALAQALGAEPGQPVTIEGREFTVEKVLAEVGMIPDDIRIFAHLHDVQAMFDKPGLVNAIDALSCYCPVAAVDVIAALEESVHKVLPDVNVKPMHAILAARNEQRIMIYKLELAAVVIVILGSATAIWGLTYQNVRNRRREIGVLRAIGMPDGRILALFLGKILFYSVVGAALGCAAGHLAAVWFNTTGRPITVQPSFILAILCASPAAAGLFGLPSILVGLTQEPTDVLRDAV